MSKFICSSSLLLLLLLLYPLHPSCAQIKSAPSGASGSSVSKTTIRPEPVDCTVGETAIFGDNIGRTANGFVPFLADPQPSDRTPAFLSMTNAYLQSAHQTYMAVSVMKAEHTSELSLLEVVLAQVGQAGSGNANPFNLAHTPTNFAIHIYDNYEELINSRIEPLYRACFTTPSSWYNINTQDPQSFNLRNDNNPNYLAGFDLDDRVTNIAAHIDVARCATPQESFVFEGGKEYLVGIYFYADWIEDGYFGVVASRKPQQSQDSRDGFYDPTFPGGDSTRGLHEDTPTLAYMATGRVTQCCTSPSECPCKFRPNPNHPHYTQWLDSCTAGDPDDWGMYEEGNSTNDDSSDETRGGADYTPYDPLNGNFPDNGISPTSGGSAGNPST